MHLRAAAGAGCKRETEGPRSPQGRSPWRVRRAVSPAMDVESLAVAAMHGMHAILSVP